MSTLPASVCAYAGPNFGHHRRAVRLAVSLEPRDRMDIRHSFIDSVGNTPLIRLASLSAETGCEILGKGEFANPGGSVKDRAALWMIRAAEEDGSLRPGGTVVEGTARIKINEPGGEPRCRSTWR